MGRCLFVSGFSIHSFLEEEEGSSWEKSLNVRLRTQTGYRGNKNYHLGAYNILNGVFHLMMAATLQSPL